MSVRERQVESALNFLNNPAVASRSDAEKEKFLLDKGVSQEEVAEAFRRWGQKSDGSTAAGQASLPDAPQASRQAAPQSAPRAVPRATPQAYSPSVQQPAASGGYPEQQYQQASYGSRSPWTGAGPSYDNADFNGMAYPGFYPPYQHPAVQQHDGGSASSGSWLPWLLGGTVAGLGATALGLVFTSQPPQPFGQVHPSAVPFQRQGDGREASFPSAAQGPQSPAPVPLEPQSMAETGGSGAGGSTAKAEPKSALDDLLATVKQQSEEAQENSKVFARALQQQQDQYQQLFQDMQKVVQLHAEKPSAKPQPAELSATTMQQLASLFRPPQGPRAAAQPPEAGHLGGGEPATGSSGPAVSADSQRNVDQAWDRRAADAGSQLPAAGGEMAAGAAGSSGPPAEERQALPPSMGMHSAIAGTGSAASSWAPGPAMAHPAEAETSAPPVHAPAPQLAIAHPAEVHAPAPQLAIAHPAEVHAPAPQLAIAHPAEAPGTESHGTGGGASGFPAPAVAHPAERSAASEEPQSGG